MQDVRSAEWDEAQSTPGRERQFCAFYSAMVERVRGYLRRRLPAPEIDDALEEVFMVVWRRWGELPENLPQRESWVFTVAARTISAAHRRAQSDARVRERLETHVGSSVPIRGAEDAILARLSAEEILARLPPSQAYIVRRAVIEDVPIEALAADLGITATALTSRLHRARLALRTLLSDKPDPIDE